MNAAAQWAMQAHREELEATGERITIRRGTGATAVNVTALARVTGLKPDELIGDIRQNDRKIIVFAPDVTFDPPLTTSDKVQRDGKPYQIIAVDDETRRIGGVLVAYEIVVRG